GPISKRCVYAPMLPTGARGFVGKQAMVGRNVRYIVRHPIGAMTNVLSDPLEAWTFLQDRYAARRERRTPPEVYKAEADWERWLHRVLGVSWPCETASEFWSLWAKLIADMERKGVSAGPMSFKGWNDGDAGLVRAIWCLTRHLRPTNVVETGVAHGVTS